MSAHFTCNGVALSEPLKWLRAGSESWPLVGQVSVSTSLSLTDCAPWAHTERRACGRAARPFSGHDKLPRNRWAWSCACCVLHAARCLLLAICCLLSAFSAFSARHASQTDGRKAQLFAEGHLEKLEETKRDETRRGATRRVGSKGMSQSAAQQLRRQSGDCDASGDSLRLWSGPRSPTAASKWIRCPQVQAPTLTTSQRWSPAASQQQQ